MGMLSGLGSFGLGDLVDADLFDDDDDQQENEEEKKAEVLKQDELQQHAEHEFVFMKTYKCPVCDQKFKNPTVRHNKARKESLTADLRVMYLNIDPLKYGVICCSHCGYAALANKFDQLSLPQIRLIREKISENFSGITVKEVLDYNDAYRRYQLALANAIVKKASDSEKANLCLKLSWLLQSRLDNFDHDIYFGNEDFSESQKEVKNLRKNALDGLKRAKKKESPPICGMDNSTLNYLMAVLASDCGLYTEASEYLELSIQSGLANKKMKKMASELEKKLKHYKRGTA